MSLAFIPLNDRSSFSPVTGVWKGERPPLQQAWVVRSTDFRGDGLLDYGNVAEVDVEQKYFAARRLAAGDIIVERSGGGPKQPVGRVALFEPPDERPYFTSNFTTALRVVNRERFDPHFVCLYLHACYLNNATARLQRATTGIRNLDWQEYLRIEVPLLDMAMQRALAHVIRDVRTAYQCEDDLIARLGALKASAMQTLFTRGLNNEPQKETDIGPIPQSWNARTIVELCEIWSGGTPRKSVSAYWEGTIPWVSGKDLKSPTLIDTVDHITPEAVENGSRLAPAGAVLLLVRGMGLAKDLPVAAITRPMAFNQDVKALVSRGEFSGQFLRSAIYAGKERLLGKIVPSAHGTMTLNLDDVETFEVACPSNHNEAEQIVTVLTAIDQKIDMHRRKRDLLSDLFESVLHKLLTGEIRVDDLNLSALDNSPNVEVTA